MASAPRKKRLTREQQRQQTRQRLCVAAAEVIADDGFQAATVENISARAGYSRGAFYSNYEDKEALFLEILEQQIEREHTVLGEIFARGSSADELRTNLRNYYALTCTENLQFVLYTEAQIHALRNNTFRRRLNALCIISRDRVAQFILDYFEARQQRIDLTRAEYLADGLMGLTSGITFAQMLDPERVNKSRAVSILMTFFDAVADYKPSV